jgi:TPR repeat protein
VKNKNLLNILILLALGGFSTATFAQAAAAEESGSGIKELFRTILFCGPGNKMCDKNYNPDASKASLESPEEVMDFFNKADQFLSGKRKDTVVQKRVDPAVPYLPATSVLAVTAAPPTQLNPPLDNDSFQKTLKGNKDVGEVIQGFLQKKQSSLPPLKVYAEGGDPWAQLFMGLAYSDGEGWTGLQNPSEACRWIKQSAIAGVSSARYFIAQRAYAKSPCFSQAPTLEQAKIWAELANQSNDASIKKDSQALIQEILKLQITGIK